MKKYLVVLSREQFNNLYQTSAIYVKCNNLIRFNAGFINQTNMKIIKFFYQLPPFKEEDDYLLLVIEKDLKNKAKDTILIKLTDVISIYALTENAKNYLEGRLDYRIKITDFLPEAIFNKILQNYKVNDIKNTVKALWELLRLEVDYNKYLKKLNINKLCNAYFFRTKVLENKVKYEPTNNKSLDNFLNYLFAYSRNSKYPKAELGYFYDAGEISAYLSGYADFSSGKYHSFLEDLKKNNIINFNDIIEQMRQSPATEKFTELTKLNDVNFSEIIPLFLMLKNDLLDALEGSNIKESKLFKNKTTYLDICGDSFYDTVALLGAFFDFRDIYSFYYDILDLKFYKDEFRKKKIEEKPTPSINKIEKTEDKATAKDELQQIIFEDEDNTKSSEQPTQDKNQEPSAEDKKLDNTNDNSLQSETNISDNKGNEQVNEGENNLTGESEKNESKPEEEDQANNNKVNENTDNKENLNNEDNGNEEQVKNDDAQNKNNIENNNVVNVNNQEPESNSAKEENAEPEENKTDDNANNQNDKQETNNDAEDLDSKSDQKDTTTEKEPKNESENQAKKGKNEKENGEQKDLKSKKNKKKK